MVQTEESVVLRKTVELCETIIAQPEFAAMRRQIEAFQADECAQLLYRELSERGAELQQKQRMGQNLEDAEIRDFEERREAFLKSEVGRGFLDAQQAMHDVRETVTRYVSRTFELGRVPNESDFHSCGCGSGCGCG